MQAVNGEKRMSESVVRGDIAVQSEPVRRDGASTTAVQECEGRDEQATDAASQYRQSNCARTSFHST